MVDEYARTRHSCFLAEMFLNSENSQYVLCFRPAAVSAASADRYTCKYLRIDAEIATAAGKAAALIPSVTRMLDNALRAISG